MTLADIIAGHRSLTIVDNPASGIYGRIRCSCLAFESDYYMRQAPSVEWAAHVASEVEKSHVVTPRPKMSHDYIGLGCCACGWEIPDGNGDDAIPATQWPVLHAQHAAEVNA